MKILSKEQASLKLKGILPTDIQILVNVFELAGFDLFLVGGCIRDAFMNKAPKDFDVCTNALPEQVTKILSDNNINFQLQGEAFGVVVAKMIEDIEIATFRTDFVRDCNIKNFIQYIRKNNSNIDEERINLLLNMSNK